MRPVSMIIHRVIVVIYKIISMVRIIRVSPYVVGKINMVIIYAGINNRNNNTITIKT